MRKYIIFHGAGKFPGAGAGKRFRPRAKIVYQIPTFNTKTERARNVYQKHVLMLKGYLDIW